jgi:hypothetical protein
MRTNDKPATTAAPQNKATAPIAETAPVAEEKKPSLPVLKLVGAGTFGSRATGIVKKGDTVTVKEEAIANRLASSGLFERVEP